MVFVIWWGASNVTDAVNDHLLAEGKKRIREIIAAAKPFPPLGEVSPGLLSHPHAKPRTSNDEAMEIKSKLTIRPSGEEFVIGADDAEEPQDLGEKRKRTPQRDRMLGALEDVELWRDADGEGYATFPGTGGHREHHAIRSRGFRRWLALRSLEKTGGIPGGQAMEDALRILEARAVYEGRQYEIWHRVARLGDTLYLDLCNDRGQAAEASARGWRVIDEPPVKFLRTPSMRALPEPEAGDCVERLGNFINFATDEDSKLAVGWLVMALSSSGPYPVIDLVGEQGSGKSVAAKVLRSLVDPSEAPLRSMPRDDRDLIIAAVNCHVLAFDNLSVVPGWFADGVCRISTGSGYATRRLHTDADEVVFSAARPVILNGIPNLTDRADLADRAIAIHLPTMADGCRRVEKGFWDEFAACRPGILGALLDGVCSALRNRETVKLDRLPRMADFALWVTAAESGLGWEPGSFIKAYDTNRLEIFEDAAEANPLVLIIREKFDRLRTCREMQEPNVWEGRPTDMLADLNSIADEGTRKGRSWPTTPSVLGSQIRRVAPTLRLCGFIVDPRKSGTRCIRIVRRSS